MLDIKKYLLAKNLGASKSRALLAGIDVPYFAGGEVAEEKTVGYSDIISITDALAKPAVSLKVAIEPVQDLHGYDNPWSAGGGKNKCGALEIGTWRESSSVGLDYDSMKIINGGRGRSANLVPVTVPMTISIASGYQYALIVFDTEQKYLGTSSFKSFRNAVYTESTQWYEDGRYIAFAIKRDDNQAFTNDDLENCHLQLELGATATSYEPYSNICPISGFDEVSVYVGETYSEEDARTYTVSLASAGTVYGGTLDVVSGELVVDRAMVDLGTLTYIPPTDNRYYTTDLSGVIRKGKDGEMWIKSSMFRTTSSLADVYNSNDAMWLSSSGNISFSKITPTATEFKTLVVGQQLVYELATPQTYQLTPTEVQMLLGNNTVWSDAGQVQLTYKVRE